MTHLAQALKKHYRKEGNKFIFRNKYTLNQLALEMWEKLGYVGMDPSVLSRILSGERLFTNPQLEAYCGSLDLTQDEVNDVKHAYWLDKMKLDSLIFYPKLISSPFDLVDMFRFSLSKNLGLLSLGKCTELKNLTETLGSQIQKFLTVIRNKTLRLELLEILVKCLYLKGRAIGSISTSDNVLGETTTIARKIFCISKETKKLLHVAYGKSLLANAYYVKGNYTAGAESKGIYNRAIKLAKEAFSNMKTDVHESLFAFRTLSASVIYLRDRLSFEGIKKTALVQLPKLPMSCYLNGIHLYNTLVKGSVVFKIHRPFQVRKLVSNHFGRSLEGTRIYEVSDIKNELEIFTILRTKNFNHLEGLAHHANQISRREGYIRHLKYINDLVKIIYN